MTQEISTTNHDILPALHSHINANPFYIDPNPSVEIDYNPQSHIKLPQILSPRSYYWHMECRRSLDIVLKRLSEKGLLGKGDIEAYFRDKNRRRLNPHILNKSF